MTVQIIMRGADFCGIALLIADMLSRRCLRRRSLRSGHFLFGGKLTAYLPQIVRACVAEENDALQMAASYDLFWQESGGFPHRFRSKGMNDRSVKPFFDRIASAFAGTPRSRNQLFIKGNLESVEQP